LGSAGLLIMEALYATDCRSDCLPVPGTPEDAPAFAKSSQILTGYHQ
jgi:hypothetical protein